MKKNIGVVGCGNISGVYLKNLTNMFKNTNVYAVCDLDDEKARAKSEEYKAKVMSFDEMLADVNIDIILNLTIPGVHYEVCKKVILAKKNIYVEKPLSITYAEGKELVELAKENNVLIGCAPDTFMGAGIYTARKIIQSDLIGDIVGASAFMMCPGHERWHPSPEFYYKLGGGPLFDMGPYYITALVNLIGPVQSVCGMSNCLRKHREIKSEPKNGQIIDVEVDTHINALLRFENGAVGNMIMSFDAYGSTLPRIEIYGTKGSLVVPDPNGFGGEVLIKQSFDTEFHTYPLLSAFSWNARGMGVSEMADCLIHGKVKNCANGEMALHVLEIMEKILKSNDLKKEIELESTFVRLEGSTIFG